MPVLKQKRTALTRFAAQLEYEGSAFSGWQFQINAQSVQAALEAAIEKRFHEVRRVGGASRTDAGVHARGQVAMFDLAYSIPARRLVTALNSALPRGVRVLRCWRVPTNWDPRRAALQKTYAYWVFNRPVESPLWQGRVWQVYQPLDLAAMRRAARWLKGRHDFSAFRAAGCEAVSPIRTLKALTVHRSGPLITLKATADAFLYHMVRNLVGTLVEVGKGRIAPDQVRAILRSRQRMNAGPTAPACGLYLERIRFRRS